MGVQRRVKNGKVEWLATWTTGEKVNGRLRRFTTVHARQKEADAARLPRLRWTRAGALTFPTPSP